MQNEITEIDELAVSFAILSGKDQSVKPSPATSKLPPSTTLTLLQTFNLPSVILNNSPACAVLKYLLKSI